MLISRGNMSMEVREGYRIPKINEFMPEIYNFIEVLVKFVSRGSRED